LKGGDIVQDGARKVIVAWNENGDVDLLKTELEKAGYKVFISLEHNNLPSFLGESRSVCRCDAAMSCECGEMRLNGGDLEIDFASHVLKKRGEQINITPAEFRILSSLAKNPHRFFSRNELIKIALKTGSEAAERIIDTHIKNIRSKIEDNASKPRYIVTVRGAGYKFNSLPSNIEMFNSLPDRTVC
jgi:DNA-binding winged helix-turn-helix (wHTH) protein